jgi:hypothetical protein
LLTAYLVAGQIQANQQQNGHQQQQQQKKGKEEEASTAGGGAEATNTADSSGGRTEDSIMPKSPETPASFPLALSAAEGNYASSSFLPKPTKSSEISASAEGHRARSKSIYEEVLQQQQPSSAPIKHEKEEEGAKGKKEKAPLKQTKSYGGGHGIDSAPPESLSSSAKKNRPVLLLGQQSFLLDIFFCFCLLTLN